jgi:hypothetical protein
MPLAIGDTFTSLQAAKQAIIASVINAGDSYKVTESTKKLLILSCKTGKHCQFYIRVLLNSKGIIIRVIMHNIYYNHLLIANLI